MSYRVEREDHERIKRIFWAYDQAKLRGDSTTAEIMADVIWSNRLEDDRIRLHMLRQNPSLDVVYRCLQKTSDNIVEDLARDIIRGRKISVADLMGLKAYRYKFDLNLIRDEVDLSRLTVSEIRRIDGKYKLKDSRQEARAFRKALEKSNRYTVGTSWNSQGVHVSLNPTHHYWGPKRITLHLGDSEIVLRSEKYRVSLSYLEGDPKTLFVLPYGAMNFPRRKRGYNSYKGELCAMMLILHEYLSWSGKRLEGLSPDGISGPQGSGHMKVEYQKAKWFLKCLKWARADNFLLSIWKMSS